MSGDPALMAAAALGALALGGAGVAAARRLRADLAAAQARLAGAGRAATRHGPIAFRAEGAGAPVVVLHGAGGGFDQGLAVASPLAARGQRVIAPSRFGYPGSAPPPPGLGPAALAHAQAEAVADLMDGLGLARAAIAGLSAGTVPALAFARRFPGRTRGLVLVAPVLRLPGAPAPIAWGPARRVLARGLLASELPLWAALTFARGWLIGRLMATDPALLRDAPPAERARIAALLGTLLPAGPRRAGCLADAEAVVAELPADWLRAPAPTLALAARDDRFGSAAVAEGLAAALPQAAARVHPAGGHLAVGCFGAMLGEAAAFLARLPD